MSPAEIQQTKILLLATAAYYNHEIKDMALALYIEDLADLPFADVSAAIGALRRDPKNRRCPLPADIRAKVMPASDPDAESIVIAGRILEAIAKIGPHRTREARELIGEVGWQVVVGSGGWETVCLIENDDIGTHRAQWRNHAKALLVSPGVKREQVALPTPAGMALLGSVLKQVPRGE